MRLKFDRWKNKPGSGDRASRLVLGLVKIADGLVNLLSVGTFRSNVELEYVKWRTSRILANERKSRTSCPYCEGSGLIKAGPKRRILCSCGG